MNFVFTRSLVASCSMETWNFFPCDRAVFVLLPLKARPWWIKWSLCFNRAIWSSKRPHLCKNQCTDQRWMIYHSDQKNTFFRSNRILQLQCFWMNASFLIQDIDSVETKNDLGRVSGNVFGYISVWGNEWRRRRVSMEASYTNLPSAGFSCHSWRRSIVVMEVWFSVADKESPIKAWGGEHRENLMKERICHTLYKSSNTLSRLSWAWSEHR